MASKPNFLFSVDDIEFGNSSGDRTFFDKDIITGTFAANAVAYYDDGVDVYVQIEKAAENLLLQSQLLSSASWTKSGLVAPGAVSDPKGGSTAFTVTAANAQQGEIYQNPTAVAGQIYTIQTFVKANGWDHLYVYGRNTIFGTILSAYYDLTGLSVGTITGTATRRFGIFDCGNGWRFVFAYALASASSSGWVIFKPTNQDGVIDAGNGSDGVILWNPSFHAGLPSSPIITAGTSVTRAKDSAYVASGSVPSGLLSGQYVCKVSSRWVGSEGLDRFLLSIDANNYVKYNGTTKRYEVCASGTVVLETAVVHVAPGTEHTVTVDCSAGAVTLADALYGDGTFYGTPWSWSVGNVYFGQDHNAANQADAAITLPKVASAISVDSVSVNAGYGEVAPYVTPTTGAANWGKGSSGTREYITTGSRSRIRQNGTLKRVRLYTSDKTGMTAFYVTVWRYNGATYDRVGISENIVASLVASSTETIDLSSPIAGVQEGDYYGYRIVTTTADLNFRLTGAGGWFTSYYVDAEAGATAYDWAAQTAVANNILAIECFMDCPYLVAIGDSIVAGHTAHYSFCEGSGGFVPDSTITGSLALWRGWTTQNMGIGGQASTAIEARFATDVLDPDPKVVILNAGLNDIAGAVAKATFIAKMTAMLVAAQADSAVETIVLLLITPCTAFSNAQMQTRDDWNVDLATLAASYGKCVVANPDDYVGQFRSGGDPGNKWDIITDMNADNTHFNALGYSEIARCVLAVING